MYLMPSRTMYDDEISINLIYNIIGYVNFTIQWIEPHCEYSGSV
jgi:hypothetical protein